MVRVSPTTKFGFFGCMVEVIGTPSSVAGILAVLNVSLCFYFIFFWAPLTPGVPGEGPDGHCHLKIKGFWAVPARIRGAV